MYIAKTLRMMNYLVKGGFTCIKVQKDKFNEDYVVFLFEDSIKLREYLSSYK